MKAISILLLAFVVIAGIYFLSKGNDSATPNTAEEETASPAVMKQEVQNQKESFIIEDPEKFYQGQR